MATERNKAVAREFIEATFARDSDRVAAVLADGMTYTIGGLHPRFRRVWTRPDWCRYLDLPTPFEKPLELSIHSIIAEGDSVALEAESHGVIAASGAVYNNHYHFHFEIRDGLIRRIREYMDTHHVNDVLPLPDM
ncbi:MAG: nuclear transport factor 2 family protein [Novosphingobium sp.]|nr:nuclear transport factor 2 family protein [Novosphingobium sp.]